MGFISYFLIDINFQTDSEPRKSLYKLRTTWPPYVPSRKLAAIDRHVHTLDPNWPITAVDNDSTGPKIFVNSKFVGVNRSACIYVQNKVTIFNTTCRVALLPLNGVSPTLMMKP